jgi:hypothetical protein
MMSEIERDGMEFDVAIVGSRLPNGSRKSRPRGPDSGPTGAVLNG